MPRIDLPPKPDIRMSPINIVEFNSIDNQHFITSIINCREEFDLLGELQARYSVVMSNAVVPENLIVIYQMVGLAQYHLLFSFSSLLRMHLSEAWASARVAIDAALIGEHLTRIPLDQERYLNGEKDIQYLVQAYKKLMKKGEMAPHVHIPKLLARYDFCSSHASHADVGVFIHRIRIVKDAEDMRLMSLSPFQVPEANEYRLIVLDLIADFALVLDMFSEFFKQVRTKLPSNWSESIQHFLAVIEARRQVLLAPQ